jgi:hypothetical protein
METGLITTDQQPEQTGGALSDLRQFAMALPSDRIQEGLEEYAERRKAFRDWLKSKLVEGIHYGYPPGCEPKYDDKGNQLVWMKGGYKAMPESQWTFKPSFYKAGADFVCDLMGLRDEYKADMDGWAQLGSPKETFVYACYLYSKSTGELIGEGRGVRAVGQKGGDANNAIKMAKKSSKVDAVLNAYGLADLFTQDIEDTPPGPPKHENPDRNQNAAKATPRSKRQTEQLYNECDKFDVAHVFTQWLVQNPATDGNMDAAREKFQGWVEVIVDRKFPTRNVAAWKHSEIEACCKAIGCPTNRDLQEDGNR